MSVQSRSVLLLLAAVVVFATGLVLTKSGRPYGTAVLTVHKVMDLVGIVLIAVMVTGALRGGGASALDWALVAVAAILTVALFATGGVVSASESPAWWMLLAHRWLPWPLLVLLGLTVYRFAARG